MSSSSSFSWERFERNDNSLSKSRRRELQSEDGDNYLKNDLFLTGYSCKLYRDDDKFLWINSGKHLIPWMGRDELRVDRYDARGYLNDMAEYETKNSNDKLSNEEIKLENRLNEERFFDLNNADKEETSNISGGQYSHVSYQYDKKESPMTENDTASKALVRVEDNSELNKNSFKPPAGLNISPGMTLPSSHKHHCIIVKTATFVARQGSQMEILLKTKQAKNSNFNFLSIDSDLHAYYKLILNEIKLGKYTFMQNNDQIESDSDNSSDDGSYLHPSLLATKKDLIEHKNKLDITNLFSAKQQEDDSYSQLVRNFKDKFSDDIADNNSEKSSDSCSSNSVSNSSNSVSSLIPQPPPEVTSIIVKLAQHVAKNGEKFEISIKKLNDTKFEFLNPGHTFHPFYVKQKIHYMKASEKEKEKDLKSKSNDSSKLIAFSIASKGVQKKMSFIEKNESSKEFDSLNEPNSLIKDKDNDEPLPKEKRLQIERKKKALEFLKMLRKENRLDDEVDDCKPYGPHLPKHKEVQLSPTIEAITSPTHSPNYTTSSSAKKGLIGLTSLLPFTANDADLKGRSLSPSPKSSRHSSRSPPRRYHDDSHERDSPTKISKLRKTSKERKSSRKRRHRSPSRSKDHSRKSKKSKSHNSSRDNKDDGKRDHHYNHHHRHHRRLSTSESRSSRSRSHTPKNKRYSEKTRHKGRTSKASHLPSRSFSKSLSRSHSR